MFTSKLNQKKILAIQNIVAAHFKNDFLISIKNHYYKGYEFPHKKQFVYSQKKITWLESKKFIEIRFLCGLQCVSKTHDVEDFFNKSFKDYPSPIFLLVPYYYQTLHADDEYLVSYQFKFEIKIKYLLSTDNLQCTFIEYLKTHELKSLKKKIKEILNVSSRGSVTLPREQGSRGSLVLTAGSSFSEPRGTCSRGKVTVKSRGDTRLWDDTSLPKKQIKLSILKTIEHMKKGECYVANITHVVNPAMKTREPCGSEKLDHAPPRDDTELPDQINISDIFDTQYFLTKWFQTKPAFGFYLSQDDIKLSCFSPERFLIKKGLKIATQPIKGTQKTGTITLWDNEKEMHEHTMIVDLLRHDLNSVCIPGSVMVHSPFYVRDCHSILQMESSILGILPKNHSLTEFMTQLLPCGSITGAPKKSACEIIAKYESHKRGYYTGIAGIIEKNHFNSKGSAKHSKNFEFALLIRSLFKGRYGVYAGVGAGITTLSRPSEEFKEFWLKLRSFL